MPILGQAPRLLSIPWQGFYQNSAKDRLLSWKNDIYLFLPDSLPDSI